MELCVFNDQMDNHPYEGAKVYRALGELHDHIIADLTELKQRTARLEDRDMAVSSALESLEEKLASILADRTRGRADLHNESHILHLSLAGDYRSLIMQ